MSFVDVIDLRYTGCGCDSFYILILTSGKVEC